MSACGRRDRGGRDCAGRGSDGRLAWALPAYDRCDRNGHAASDGLAAVHGTRGSERRLRESLAVRWRDGTVVMFCLCWEDSPSKEPVHFVFNDCYGMWL